MWGNRRVVEEFLSWLSLTNMASWNFLNCWCFLPKIYHEYLMSNKTIRTGWNFHQHNLFKFMKSFIKSDIKPVDISAVWFYCLSCKLQGTSNSLRTVRPNLWHSSHWGLCRPAADCLWCTRSFLRYEFWFNLLVQFYLRICHRLCCGAWKLL